MKLTVLAPPPGPLSSLLLLPKKSKQKQRAHRQRECLSPRTEAATSSPSPCYILVLLGKEGSGSRGDGGRAEHLEHALADAIGRPPAVALASTKRLGETYLGWMAHVRLLPLLIAVSLTFPRAAAASDPGSIYWE